MEFLLEFDGADFTLQVAQSNGMKYASVVQKLM